MAYGVAMNYPEINYADMVPYILADIHPFVGDAELDAGFVMVLISFILCLHNRVKDIRRLTMRGKITKLVELFRTFAPDFLLVSENCLLLPVACMLDLYWVTGVESIEDHPDRSGRSYPKTWPVACLKCYLEQDQDGTHQLWPTNKYVLLPRDLFSETTRCWIYNGFLQGNSYAHLRARYGAPFATQDTKRNRFDNGAFCQKIVRDADANKDVILEQIRFAMTRQCSRLWLEYVARTMERRTCIAEHFSARLEHFGGRNVTPNFDFIPQPNSASIINVLRSTRPDCGAGPSDFHGAGPSSSPGPSFQAAAEPNAPRKAAKRSRELTNLQYIMMASDDEDTTTTAKANKRTKTSNPTETPTLQRQNASHTLMDDLAAAVDMELNTDNTAPTTPAVAAAPATSPPEDLFASDEEIDVAVLLSWLNS